MKKTIFILFLWTVIICLPFLLNSLTTLPRLDSDYDWFLALYGYLGAYVRHFHAFPTSIPFIGSGISVIGDPLNGILNPLLFIPVVLLPINIAVRVIIFLVIFFAGFSMYYFLKSITVTKLLQYFGALLYMTSGSVIAAISAGHITEKFLSIPFIPLFLKILFDKKTSMRKNCLLGFCIAAVMYSGDFYMAWFLYIFLLSIAIYRFIQEKSFLRTKEVAFTILFSLLFASPKLYALYILVLPVMVRYFPVEPFRGSIHAFLLPLQFLVPLQVTFYDKPFFQKHLGFYYNWYEYYGFIGIFCFIFFKNIKKVLRQDTVLMMSFLIVIGSLYLASAFWYSPFHWLFIFWHGPTVFRVPQRIIVPLTPVVIGLLCILGSTWNNKKTLILICIASLFFNVSIAWLTFSHTFISIPGNEQKIARSFANVYKKGDKVVVLAPKMLFFLTEQGVSILNFYYGWTTRGSATFLSENGHISLNLVLNSKPNYIFATTENFSSSDYTNYLHKDTITVWKKNVE